MVYDCIIIGGGPAGLTAGIYAARSGMKTLLLEKMTPGGQMAFIHKLENYPGTNGISGVDLSMEMQQQAESIGVEFEYEAVVQAEINGKIKSVKTESGKIYEAKTLIICTGASHKHLGIPKETELAGAGVSYCAVCDGAFFKNQDVAVVGGGNTALQDTLYLASICRKVYLIHRRSEFRASKILVDRARKLDNVEFVLNAQVKELSGENSLTGIKVEGNCGPRNYEVSGLFIAVGMIPDNAIAEGLELNNGYIVTDENMRTSVEGVYAAGDIRAKEMRQVITAASDGAIAANSAAMFLMV